MAATRVIIHHLGGSKINQVEQFPVDSYSELTIGRDTGMAIAYDAARDDMVSRRHAIIRIQAGDPPIFKLADTGSSNGTLLNGKRIANESELQPGDIIELGSGGPKFSFDVDPRPARAVAPTRMMAAAPSATRMVNTAGNTPAATIPPTGEIKSSVGRDTVMRMVSEQRQRQSRTVIYAIAAVLIIIGLVGGGLYYKNKQDLAAEEQAQQAALAQKAAQMEQADKARAAEMRNQMGLSPEEIAARYGNATVLINVQWRLFDRSTGKQVFHKVVTVNNKPYPAYVKLENGNIVRWLTTEDDMHTNVPIGEQAQGTGFVVTDQGAIFTNKHVAAGWKINYNAISSYESGDGVLYFQQPQIWNDKIAAQSMEHAAWLKAHQTQVVSLNDSKSVLSWQPEDGGVLFLNGAPVVDNGNAKFEGRNEQLSVRFPGTRVDIDARLVRASSDADAAVIKIDSTEKLKFAPVAQDDIVNVGQRVVCLGYPAFTEKNVAVIRTVENGERRNQLEVIPEPTVTPGYITNISVATHDVGNVTITALMGNVYQMSLPSGAGNSGGPIFDDRGQVIGLFTYGNGQNQTVTYAVPIKYARDLLTMQRS